MPGGIVARRIKIPYTVGLVVIGVLLAADGTLPSLRLSHDLIFKVLLPPLIFEAALHLKWREVREHALRLGLLATVGVLISAFVVTVALTTFTSLGWQSAIVIGAVLAATDPVSVLALLKEAKLQPKIHKLVEAESLFNDGTASVLFAIVPLIIAGEASPLSVATISLTSIFGGLAIGVCIGLAILTVAGETRDHLIELAVTVVAAFGSFMIAEHLHTSGILSTLAAGMVLGNLDRSGAISEKGREAANSFWEFAGFVANSFIFILIGIELPEWGGADSWTVIVATILAMIAARALSVYGTCLPLRSTASAVPLPVQHLLFWGGLRGALSIALALGLPENFPDRAVIISAVFYAVAFSIVVQGLTVSPLIRKVRATQG